MVRCKLKGILFCVATSFVIFAEEMSKSETTSIKNSKKRSTVAISSQLIDFKYDQKDIKDILNDFAQMRGINLIYPEADTITAKVTFDAGKQITMLEAWEFVVMILSQAGFTLVNRDANTYFIIANKDASKEALPLYINVDYQSLPDSQEKIRYIYYCNSIQLSTKQSAEITAILTKIFWPTDFAEKVQLDTSFNAIIFTASAEMIKAAMNIVSVFDEVGMKESVEILRLHYAQASEVALILTNMIGADPKKAAGYVSLTTGTSKARYFSESATVLDLDPKQVRKLNSLVVMGRAEDVGNIIDFIKKYLDIPQQQGKSFFHVVELEWLQAATFAPILSNLIKGAGGSGQSTSSIASGLAFDPQIQVIVETTTPPPANNPPSSSYSVSGANANASPNITPNVAQRGGNRIIIAASERDWSRIEGLIKQVDTPRKQVIVEALVVDLDLEFVRRLATQLRTRGLTPTVFPKYMQAQAGLVLGNIINTDSNNNLSLTGDLSAILAGATSGPGNPGPVGGFTPPGQSLSNNGQVPWSGSAFAGGGEDATTATVAPSQIPALNSSTIFMVGNGPESNGVWAFFQLLSTHKSAKTLTRPVIVASNNQPASITSAVLKNLAGGVSSGNSPTVNYSYLPAVISIGFTPIISHNNMINLQININLCLWEDPANETNGTQVNRVLTTNISSKSGDVIILGGLIKEVVSRSKKSIPFFDKIPVLGSFVANRYKNTTRDQLFILLRATVVAPRVQGGMGPMTKHAANYTIQQFQDYEDAFSTLKDPITRWFFNEDMDRGSEQVNDKLDVLTKIATPNTESEELSQIEAFMKPQYKSNPLGVNWLGDKSLAQKESIEDKNAADLEQKLKTIVNPFQKRLVV